jgi:hypothetical protein
MQCILRWGQPDGAPPSRSDSLVVHPAPPLLDTTLALRLAAGFVAVRMSPQETVLEFMGVDSEQPLARFALAASPRSGSGGISHTAPQV